MYNQFKLFARMIDVLRIPQYPANLLLVIIRSPFQLNDAQPIIAAGKEEAIADAIESRLFWIG
jgi:hypothetical protein